VNEEVLQVQLWNGIQFYITEQAGEPPEILVFKPAAGRTLENLHRNLIFAIVQVICNCKFCWGEAVLMVADKCSVDPQSHCRFCPMKDQPNLCIFAECLRNCHHADIAARGVEAFRDLTRLAVLHAIPRIHGIDILHLSIAIGL